MTEEQRDWYQTAAEFYKDEMATLGWRTNIFIVAQSILVSGFILLVVNRQKFICWPSPIAFLIFAISLALVGFCYCIVHYFSGKSAATAAEFWRAYMYDLENYTRVAAPWHALREYYNRVSGREYRWLRDSRRLEKWGRVIKHKRPKFWKSQTSEHEQDKAPPRYERSLLCMKPGPASWFILPAILGLAWLIAVGLMLWSTGLLWPWALCLIIPLFSVPAALNRPQRLWRPIQEALIWVLHQFNT